MVIAPVSTPTRVLFSDSVVRDLRSRAIEAFVSLPKRGVEIGGILFGHAQPGVIQIEGFEEVACEHRYGPSYALSEDDRASLAGLLAQRQAGGSLPIAGFYRSFTAREPAIEAADEQFVREHFPHGDFVFLMLQPLSPQSCVASLRFFHDGELLAEDGHPPFAFDPATLDTAAPIPPAAAPPPPSPLPPPRRVRAESEETVARPRRRRWWLPLAVCLIAGIGGAAIYELWALAREPRWAELHLDAKPVGGQLEVTWDASAPAAASAPRGMLAITDGAHRDIQLTAAQIRAGKYTVATVNSDVEVRLILYKKGIGAAGDAVRVAAVQMPAAPAPAQVNEADRAVERSPIHEVQPYIPGGIRSRIPGRIAVPVQVRVNPAGRVIYAKADVPAGDGLHRYLAEQAQKAALQWRFNPAPTTSTETVRFVFRP